MQMQFKSAGWPIGRLPLTDWVNVPTVLVTGPAAAQNSPEGGSQKATLVVVVVVVVVVISSLKIPKAFLIRRRAQRKFAYTFVLTLPTDLSSQIFKVISN